MKLMTISAAVAATFVFAQSGRGGPADKAAAKSYYERAAALGDDNAKALLRRLNCPLMLSDKKGNPLTDLCF